MTCKGICNTYKAVKKCIGSRYAEGQKRCNYCGIFMIWNKRQCPCCGHNLRTKPRFRSYKEKKLNAESTLQNTCEV